ncbi:unnamed protein product, partial [Laminaria digitata]
MYQVAFVAVRALVGTTRHLLVASFRIHADNNFRTYEGSIGPSVKNTFLLVSAPYIALRIFGFRVRCRQAPKEKTRVRLTEVKRRQYHETETLFVNYYYHAFVGYQTLNPTCT